MLSPPSVCDGVRAFQILTRDSTGLHLLLRDISRAALPTRANLVFPTIPQITRMALPSQKGDIIVQMFVIYRHPPAKATNRASLRFGVEALVALSKGSVEIGACSAYSCQPPPPIFSRSKISRICHKGLPAISAPPALRQNLIVKKKHLYSSALISRLV